MKILLANDTGVIPHYGCQAVSEAHARMLGRAGHEVTKRYFATELADFSGEDIESGQKAILNHPELRAEIESVDAVVVNGEGTIHHGSGSEYIALLGAAQALDKTTLLVNAVYQESNLGIDILKKLDQFSVRDQKSQESAQNQGIECRLVPDSCLEAQFDTQSDLDLEGRDVVTDWHFARDSDTGEASFRFLKDRGYGCVFFPFESPDAFLLWKQIPSSLATAGAIVTGRHHAAYMAAMARRPFVLLGSNTHKIEGFVDMIPPGVEICGNYDRLQQTVDDAKANEKAFGEIADYLESLKPLPTFAVIDGARDAAGEAREIETLSRDIQSRSNLTRMIAGRGILRRSDEFRLLCRAWKSDEKGFSKALKQNDKLEKRFTSLVDQLNKWNQRPWFRRICRRIRF